MGNLQDMERLVLASGSARRKDILTRLGLDFDIRVADVDESTAPGEDPAEVARRAKEHGLPVVALAGTIGKGVTANFDHGIDAFSSILKRPCKLEDAIAAADKLLVRAAEDSMRMVGVGIGLSRRDKGYFATVRNTANRTLDRIMSCRLAA